MKSKGMAGGVNIIVTMVIGMVMLIGGLSLFFTLFSDFQETGLQIDQQLRDEIMNRHNDGSPMYVYPNNVETQRQSSSLFGGSDDDNRFFVGINNEGERREFEIDSILFGDGSDASGNVTFTYLSFGNMSRGESDVYPVLFEVENLARNQQHRFVITVNADGDEYATRNIFLNVR